MDTFYPFIYKFLRLSSFPLMVQIRMNAYAFLVLILDFREESYEDPSGKEFWDGMKTDGGSPLWF